jgi:hypothetical protein
MLRALIPITLYLSLIILASPVAAQSTAFTYQGKLTNSGNLANGNYEPQADLCKAKPVK